MNPRTALLCKWRFLGVYSVCSLVTLAAFAAPKRTGTPHSTSFRGGEHATDLLLGEKAGPAKDLLLTVEDEKKSDALASFVDGLIAEENADGEKALEAFQKVLNLDPSNTELAIKVAYEQARRGAVDQGIGTLKDAIKARPKDPLPYLYLSQLYSKYLRKTELALRYAQAALDLDPKNFACHVALYELYVTSNQARKAQQVLDRAAAVETDDSQYWLQLTELFARVYLKEDGSGTAESVRKVGEALEKAVKTADGDPVALARAADYYVLTRQVKEAIPLYLQALKAKDGAPADLSFTSLQDKLARSFKLVGQRDEAIEMLKQLIKENPLRYESYELLGELYEEQGDYEKALASYRQTLLIDGTQPVNYLRVADMLRKAKQVDKAVEILKEARQKFPDLPQITYSLAVVMGEAKRYAESLPLFEEALNEAVDKQQDMVNAAFYFSYGAASERAGLLEKAAELLHKSIELDPANAAQAYNYLGYMWLEKGERLEEAGDLIKKAVEMEPDNPAFIDSLGWFEYKRGDYKKAVEQLLKAAELMKPEDAVVYEHVADAYARQNDIAQALIYWQKAGTLDPENKGIWDKIESAKQKMTANGKGPES